MKVLVVEDKASEVHLIRDTLAHLGWRIEDAPTIERGFALVDVFGPDVILLDLDLPDSMPKETLKAIPRLGTNGAMVVLSGHVTQEIIAEAFKQGADDCLDKQCLSDPKYFIQAIRHGYERFMRRTNLSKKEAGPVLRALTEAEAGSLAAIPSLRRDVDELRIDVLTGPNSLKTGVAVLRDQMKRLDDKATVRTILLILFLVFNAAVTLYNAHEHANLPQLQMPNAPGD